MASRATKWNCRNCGRANKTILAADGATACEYCTEIVKGQEPARRAAPPVARRQIVAP